MLSCITPIFKKGDRLLKTNYRPVSILATLAKVYEKLLYPQIYDYFDCIFSKYLGGFRKGHSTQHCLLIMLEKLRGALDKGLVTGILLTDLSKAFDRIPHELLAAKLYAYGFKKKKKNSVKLIYDYLSGRTQMTKVNNSFSKWLEIMFGVPQGSILGVILFNIYINDLFFSAEFQMANFADDCSPFDFGATKDVIKKLEEQPELLIEWYWCNYPNPDKWHLILSKKGSSDFINIDGQKIFNSENEKVLGIYFDNKLNFEHHIGKITCPRESVVFYELPSEKDYHECIH